LVLPRSSATSDRCALWNVCHPSVNTSVYTSVIMAGASVIVAKYRNFFATLCEIPTGTNPSVIVAKCCNFFVTLCEIPTGRIPSIYPLVIVAKCCNFFVTLCEIPTGRIPSIYPLVIVAKCCNFFATLYEIPTGTSPLVYPSVKLAIFLQVLFVLRVYPPAQKLELQTYSTHNTITRADNYK